MMSLEYIHSENRKRAAEAARESREPFVYFDADEVREGFPFPHLGDYRPDGWELVGTHFVDATGFGDDREPALSVPRFVALIKDRITSSQRTVGWAVIEAGQFQVYVGEFVRSPGTVGNAGSVEEAADADFAEYMEEVDEVIRDTVGLTHNDLPDWHWRDAFIDGMPAEEAAVEAMEYADVPDELLEALR